MRLKLLLNIVLSATLTAGGLTGAGAAEPSNPNATPEARALLDVFYRISGKYTLTGQHNYPASKDYNTRFAAKYIGMTPVIWSSDFGFAKAGDKDSYLSRPDIVKEAIRQYRKGSIITLCWHAVPPTANEPVIFNSGRNSNTQSDSLTTVQGQLTDRQFKDILTPGTKLYNHWAAQVDTIAHYLKELQDAHVPVIFRAYHEMNGDWFWWGGRVGRYSTLDLYRQIHDRFVKYHKLNNLLWVWSVDRPSTPIRKFSNFYPGNDYLDILALDVYGSDFKQAYYDSLMALSKGKPIVLGEVGNPPGPDVLKNQPDWAYWVVWAGMTRLTSKEQYAEYVNDPRILFQEKPSYWEVINPYRKVCGLPPLPLKNVYPTVDFSGYWILNEAKSQSSGGGGRGSAGRGGGDETFKMLIDQDNDLLTVTRFAIVQEYEPVQTSTGEMFLDGSETKTTREGSGFGGNVETVTKAAWDSDSRSIKVNMKRSVNFGGQIRVTNSTGEWSLRNGGKELVVKQTSPGSGGGAERTSTLVYDKQ